ncbi:hypothetical protein CAEBREN_17509 [Caenorhabditis brenneri]|uniref:Mutator-like transposase domain-containing protein n=1 Tax=Caenorhabditis brenneri TaxID=135651 RepID=G0P7H8_CAEBE|nr:hypothetical protein CAEBREN_17509 [Caenorhabditis brenneri]
MSSIVSLLKKCRVCLENADVNTSQSGFNVSITCHCTKCERSWTWHNSEMCEAEDKRDHKGRLRELHLDITGAVFSTGSSYQKIKQFFDVMNCSTFSARTYNKLKEAYLYPAVGIYYNDMLQWVQEMMRNLVNENGSINLVGDGSYDSRGRCACFCRYVVMEATLKLAVDYEVLRQKSGECQRDMELKGFEECLKRVAGNFSSEFHRNVVASFTSDRSKSIATSMQVNFPNINHYYDSWHFFRNIAMDIIKKRNLQKFKPIADWVRSFLNHMYYSVSESEGDGQLAKERLLSFFYHVTDKHKNFDTGKWFKLNNFTECEHEDYEEFDERSASFLNSNSKSDVKALNILFSILKKGKRLDDIKKVSPYYATSCIESLNFRAITYATKDHYFSEDGFKIRTMLTLIDWNERRKDEIEGRRVVIGEKPYYNKTSKRNSTKEVKTPTNYSWRREILNIAHALRVAGRRESFEVGYAVDCEDDEDDVEMDDGGSVGARGLSDYSEEEDVDSVWDKLALLHEDEYDSGDETEEREIDSIRDQLPFVNDEEEEEIEDREDYF